MWSELWWRSQLSQHSCFLRVLSLLAFSALSLRMMSSEYMLCLELKKRTIVQSMLGEHVGLEHLLDSDGGRLHHPGGL